jgi:hypothetical protein
MPRVVPSQVVEVIDRLVPEAAKGESITWRHGPVLTGILRLVDQIPSELSPSVAADYSLLITATAALRVSIEAWTNGTATNYPLPPISGVEGRNAVAIIREVLARCGDASPTQATSDLPFIPDVVLQANLRLDLSAVNTSLANGEWKSATVLAGSLCEALLLWKLQQEPPAKVTSTAAALVPATLAKAPSPDLEDWNLHQYLEVCGSLKLITADTAKQVRLAKNFRNLIHPGLARRLGQKCDRGTALAATAAVELIIRDFTP